MHFPHPYQTLDLSNVDGRVFAVGDIHGQFSDLMNALNEHGYNPSKDHVLFVGDLVDRGYGSMMVLDAVLTQPNMHMVIGNHEHVIMHIQHHRLRGVKNKEGLKRAMAGAEQWERDFLLNYGYWIESLEAVEWPDFHAHVESLKDQPIVLDVSLPKGRRVVLSHATCPSGPIERTIEEISPDSPRALRNWWIGFLTENRTHPELTHSLLQVSDERDQMIGPVRRIHTAINHPHHSVGGVDMVIHGHTVMPQPALVGNHLYLDTGACFKTQGGRLTMVDVMEIIDQI